MTVATSKTDVFFCAGQTQDSWPSAPCGDDASGDTPVRTGTYGSYYDSAAGDFCLLPSRIMHSIRGFAEIPNNIFMDGTAMHAAAAHGFGQQVFKPPCSIFHQVAAACWARGGCGCGHGH